MSSKLSQKIIAEFVGTLFLVASVLGAGHMTRALGAGSAEGLTMIALAVGFVLVVIVSVFGPISGGHFNPAVSLMMALRRELSPSQTSAYIFSQILGAATGAFFANVMFGASSWSLSD
ncbi:MAG: aquaporin family protein, partial [Microbacteriaceae bacterium]|nr:aquaporin family protein [Microbacteriaceae bacterium]